MATQIFFFFYIMAPLFFLWKKASLKIDLVSPLTTRVASCNLTCMPTMFYNIKLHSLPAGILQVVRCLCK